MAPQKQRHTILIALLCWICFCATGPLVLFWTLLPAAPPQPPPLLSCDVAAARKAGNTSGDHLTLVSAYDNSPFFASIGEDLEANRVAYARRHGYGLLIFAGCSLAADGLMHTKRATQVEKINAVLEALDLVRGDAGKTSDQNSQWLWWLDADAVLTNLDQPLSVMLPQMRRPSLQMLLTVDWNGLNSGSFVTRVSAWSRAFWKRALSSALEGNLNDQDAMLKIFEEMSIEMQDVGDGKEDSGFSPSTIEYDSISSNTTVDPTAAAISKRWPKALHMRVQFVAKRAINAYPQDFRPGDLVVHQPGCLVGRKVETCIADWYRFFRTASRPPGR